MEKLLRTSLILSGIFSLLLACGCLTKMAHKYTFPGDFEFDYPDRLVKVLPGKGDSLELCMGVKRRKIMVGLKPKAPNRQVSAPYKTYQMNLMGRVPVVGCSAGEGLKEIPLKRQELYFPELGQVLELPRKARFKIPVYTGSSLAKTFGRIKTADYYKSSGMILLKNKQGDSLTLKPGFRSEIKGNARYGYAYKKNKFYIPLKDFIPKGDLVPPRSIKIREIKNKEQTLLLYYITADRKLHRRIFINPVQKQMLAVYLPHYAVREIKFRPLGLCLYPPAVVGDILTGIFQIFYWVDKTTMGCLFK